MAFDPTPAQEGRPEVQGGLTYDERSEAFSGELQRWLQGQSGGSLARVLAAGVRTTVSRLTAQPLASLGILIVALLAYGLLRQPKRPIAGRPVTITGHHDPRQLAAERLVRSLRSLRFPRRRGQTLLQLANQASIADPELRQVERAAKLHYSARWGGAAHGAAELNELLGELEALVSKSEM